MAETSRTIMSISFVRQVDIELPCKCKANAGSYITCLYEDVGMISVKSDMAEFAYLRFSRSFK